MDPNNDQRPADVTPPVTTDVNEPQGVVNAPNTDTSLNMNQAQPAPAVPTADPVAVSPVTPPQQPGAPKKPNFLVPALVALAVLLAIGVAVWYFLFNVTKDDYKKADTAAQDVKTVYGDASKKFEVYFANQMSGYSTESEINESKEAFDKVYADYKKKADALKDQKALRDGEVKKVYDEFTSQNEKFTKAVDGLIALSPDMKTTTEECGSADMNDAVSGATPENILERYDEAMKACKESLQKLSTASVEPIAEYGKNALKAIEAIRGYMEDIQIAAKTNDQRAAQQAYTNMISDSTVKAMTSNDLGKALKEYNDEVEVKGKLEALVDLLTSKAA